MYGDIFYSVVFSLGMVLRVFPIRADVEHVFKGTTESTLSSHLTRPYTYLRLLDVSLTSLENMALTACRNEETESSIGLIRAPNVTATVDSHSKNPVSIPQLVLFTSHSSTGQVEAPCDIMTRI